MKGYIITTKHKINWNTTINYFGYKTIEAAVEYIKAIDSNAKELTAMVYESTYCVYEITEIAIV